MKHSDETSRRSRYGPVDNRNSRISMLNTLPFNAVQIRGGFWCVHQELNHRVSLHHAYRQLSHDGSFDSFRRCAGLEASNLDGSHFHEAHDTHVYKWLEGVAWELAKAPDDELRGYVEEVVPLIEAAQAEDGYLVTPIQLYHPERRWTDLHFGHEMYCAGHLIQAAVALQRALGDERLLRVACRFADHIDTLFGPGKRSGTCGHPEIETALVELYRATGEERYLRLATFLVDERGQNRLSGLGSYGPEYHQDHTPVRQADEAVGHAVRQLYLATGVADLYMETGEPALNDYLHTLWKDINSRKAHITGGMGARFEGEAFGDAYELPTDQCYCETCAAIGDAMWNWRMLLMTGESRYADQIERALYNTVLSSPSQDGEHYFYVNPLMLRKTQFMRMSTNRPDPAHAVDGRPEWHGVACCPPNVMRVLASLSHYFATHNETGVQIHLYGGASIQCSLQKGGQVQLEVRTEYPWQGDIQVSVMQTGESPWTLSLRKPGWCKHYTCEVNGEQADPTLANGYLCIQRKWQAGDQVRLVFDMSPVYMISNPRVDALRGCAAIQRGPLVYCLESHDQDISVNLLDVLVDPQKPLREEWREGLLGGVMVVHADGHSSIDGWGDDLYAPFGDQPKPSSWPIDITAIPYYTWGNRGLREMRVWIPMISKDR